MPRAMYGWTWTDGTYRDGPEPRPELELPQPPPRKPWTPSGFFKDGPDAARQAARIRNGRASLYREWLRHTLTKPMLAREVLKRAKQADLSEGGIRRAKKRLGIVTIRAGGKGTGRCNPWVWMFGVAE